MITALQYMDFIKCWVATDLAIAATIVIGIVLHNIWEAYK